MVRLWIMVGIAACGRIGFESARGGSGAGDGGGSNGGSGSGSGNGGDAGVCAYHACPGGQSGCCTGGTNTCMDPQTCMGQVVECDPVTNMPCTQPQTHCCQFMGMAATTCTLPNVNCN